MDKLTIIMLLAFFAFIFLLGVGGLYLMSSGTTATGGTSGATPTFGQAGPYSNQPTQSTQPMNQPTSSPTGTPAGVTPSGGTPSGSTPSGITPSGNTPSGTAPESTPEPLQQPKTKTFCEGNYASSSITCPSNLKINSFKYGRPASSTCLLNGKSYPPCAGKDYTSQAQALVAGGTLAFSNPVHKLQGFNDPCPNIYKQIDINYTCS